jgi:hypothetical protein
MSFIFPSLMTAYPTWEAMKTFLTSEAGGCLSVYEVPETMLAMVRYVKGQSNMSLAHVGAFRSVVWNTVTNKPVSVTAFKSEAGEGLLGFDTDIVMEEFVDGVMVGQFWDADAEKWRIHTRSTLDAKCRYYSTRSFADLFADAAAVYGNLEDHLEKGVSYTWILQHPENRIVCPVQKPRLVLVAAYRIQDGAVESVDAPEGVQTPRRYYTKVDSPMGRMDMSAMLEVVGIVNRAEHDLEGAAHTQAPGYIPADMMGVISMIASMRGSVRYQGVVIKDAKQPLKRWKMRSQVYNQVRKMRGNTARRDFLWMDLWSKGSLEEYLKFYPEERMPVNDIINRWKVITQSVFKIYVDAFKARTMDRSQIPNKFRPLVYGLHNLYMTGLKPARKVLDWRACVQWMNERDTAQKVFVLNWDLRQEQQERSAAQVPLEPAATATVVPAAAPASAVAPGGEPLAALEEGEITA